MGISCKPIEMRTKNAIKIGEYLEKTTVCSINDIIFQNPVKANFSLLWKFFEPISFGLIGMEVDFSVLEADVVLWGSLAMIIALLVNNLYFFNHNLSVIFIYR